MARIRLWINEPWAQSNARILETIRRYEAGELTEDCDLDFGFASWEHFASVLKTDAPGLADELADALLTMPEADRYAVIHTPAGQEILLRLWERVTIDTSCPG